MTTSLRVGLLISGQQVPAWFHLMVAKLISCEYAELSLLVIMEPASPANSRQGRANIAPGSQAPGGRITRFLHKLIVDRTAPHPDPLDLTSLSSLTTDVPRIECRTRIENGEHFLEEAGLQKVKNQNLDVLILGCGYRLSGPILDSARSGVWMLKTGDEHIGSAAPPGFWETMECWPATGVMLLLLGRSQSQDRELCRSYACTNRGSVAMNRANAFWKASVLLPRKLKELSQLGQTRFLKKYVHQNPPLELCSGRACQEPTTSRHLQLIVKKGWSKARSTVSERFYCDQWTILFSRASHVPPVVRDYIRLTPPKNSFWADPHVVRSRDDLFIFYEDYPYSTGRGRIAVMQVYPDNTVSEPQIVLERPYHLSYPFVFEVKGQFFMIPETAESGNIELYRCVDFPYRWEHQRNLIEGIRAVDATLYNYDDRWWMFACVSESKGISLNDELFVFFCSDFENDEWTAHRANPVISDVRIARPAGPLFRSNAELYRPSQDCSGRYGRGLHFNKVLRLDEEAYEERRVSSLYPEWDKSAVAIHSYSSVDGLTALDAQFRVRR